MSGKIPGPGDWIPVRHPNLFGDILERISDVAHRKAEFVEPIKHPRMDVDPILLDRAQEMPQGRYRADRGRMLPSRAPCRPACLVSFDPMAVRMSGDRQFRLRKTDSVETNYSSRCG